jgi:hypothetical protein
MNDNQIKWQFGGESLCDRWMIGMNGITESIMIPWNGVEITFLDRI